MTTIAHMQTYQVVWVALVYLAVGSSIFDVVLDALPLFLHHHLLFLLWLSLQTSPGTDLLKMVRHNTGS